MPKLPSKPKLTLKKARAISIAEIGTAAGLAPHENNHTNFRLYEMRLGNNFNVVRIRECNEYAYLGHASISFCGHEVIYDIETAEINLTLTDKIQMKRAVDCVELYAGAKSYREAVFRTFVEQVGYDECLEMLNRVAREE